MAQGVLADFCRNSTTSTGSGNLVLGSAINGYSDIVSVLASGDSFGYSLFEVDDYGSPAGDWETGAGSLIGSQLRRDKIFATSAGGSNPSPLNLSSGTKHVILSAPGKVLCSPNGMNCRLSLSSTSQVTTSDATGTTLYLHAYGDGNVVTLWNGCLFERWQLPTTGYLSLALSGTSANTNYDVYLYQHQGTLYLGLNAAWSSGTARSASNTPVRKYGLLVNDASFTETVSGRTVASNQGAYLGTLRTTTANNMADSESQRLLWNVYHRKSRKLRVEESTSSWTYNAASWRYANNDSTNKVEFVVGLTECESLSFFLYAGAVSAAGATTFAGVGLDSTTPASPHALGGSGIGYRQNMTIYGNFKPSELLGYHYAAMCEYGSATGPPTFLACHMTGEFHG